MDWHQTETFVVVSVYAKKYLPNQSIVKLNPIHLIAELFFVEENSRYNLDIELRGVCISMCSIRGLLIIQFTHLFIT